MKKWKKAAAVVNAVAMSFCLMMQGGNDTAFGAEDAEYVLMNIPYAEFYEAEVENDIPVDAFSSATLNKTRTGTLAGGSYHVNEDGTDITGITFPVKVGEGVDLSEFKQVTEEDSVTISVTNRGQTSETTYSGKEALFENESYAYYVLEEEPAFYKELTVDEEGNLSFGKTVGERQTVSGVIPELTTETGYGDYGLYMNGLEDVIDMDSMLVYAVVIGTEEGDSYGLRHLENIWRVTSLAWCTGFTADVHNCPTSSEHYESMMGQHINLVTYYTSGGIFEIPVDTLYVPVKFENSAAAADAAVTAGAAALTVEGLPEDYDAQYTVENLDGVRVENGTLYFDEAEKGQYTLVISDKNGKYADISTSFILYTEDMPAAFDAAKLALTAAEGFDAEDLSEYLRSITAVSVNGISYPASGRGSVAIVGEDGAVTLEATEAAGAESAEITIAATGYKELTFTYAAAEPDQPVEELPATGAASQLLIMLAGAALVMTGAGVLSAKKRRAAN